MLLAAIIMLQATAFTPAQQETIKAAVGQKLKDPFSAHYEWQPVRKDRVYCGWVNAKNSYGGYSGYEPFLMVYHIKPDTVQIVVELVRLDQDLVTTVCRENGYQIER